MVSPSFSWCGEATVTSSSKCGTPSAVIRADWQPVPACNRQGRTPRNAVRHATTNVLAARVLIIVGSLARSIYALNGSATASAATAISGTR